MKGLRAGASFSVLATRVRPRHVRDCESKQRSDPELRQSNEGVALFAMTDGKDEKERKESGTPKNADDHPPHLAVRLAPCKARSPSGVPPRLSSKGLTHPKAQLGPGFVGNAPVSSRVLPPAPHPLPAMHLARRS
jgi:hypothetical protein